jgi:hypothetical protein
MERKMEKRRIIFWDELDGEMLEELLGHAALTLPSSKEFSGEVSAAPKKRGAGYSREELLALKTGAWQRITGRC